jgi:predicted MFS family arabinose efflux permease
MTNVRGMIGAVYAGVVALLVVNVLPALVNLIAINLKWDERALGLLASADVAGITLGSIIGVPAVRRLALRTVVVWGILVLVAADLACGAAGARVLMVAYRFIGGCASGIILAACYAIYSYANAQTNFATFSVGQMVSGFIGVTALPILATHFGWRSSFYSIALVTAIALPLVRHLPAQPFAKASRPTHTASHPHTGVAVWFAVGGLIVYIIGEGAVWTFMERIGADSGLSEHDINVAVSACTLAGVLGAVVTMFPSKRLGVVLPLTASAALSVAGCLGMRSPEPTVYLAALVAFTFAWLAFATVQFAAIAEADTAGTATISMSAAWYAGFAVGPYLAGELVVKYGYSSVQFLGIVGVVFALVSLLPLRLHVRKAAT